MEELKATDWLNWVITEDPEPLLVIHPDNKMMFGGEPLSPEDFTSFLTEVRKLKGKTLAEKTDTLAGLWMLALDIAYPIRGRAEDLDKITERALKLL